MKHQDWEPVTFTRESKSQKKTIIPNDNLKKLINEEGTKPKTWSSKCIKNVVTLRVHNLHLSQDEFAKRLNVSASVIKNLENGTGNYDGKLVHKINQIFKVNLNGD